MAFCRAEKLPASAGNYLGFFVLHLICVERTGRKLSILYRQNEMQETLCYLFPIDRRLPKLNVAGSIPLQTFLFPENLSYRNGTQVDSLSAIFLWL